MLMSFILNLHSLVLNTGHVSDILWAIGLSNTKPAYTDNMISFYGYYTMPPRKSKKNAQQISHAGSSTPAVAVLTPKQIIAALAQLLEGQHQMQQ